MIRRWFVNGILPLLLVVTVWAVIVTYWRSGDHAPDIKTMILYLIGLPAVLLAVVVMARKGIVGLVRARKSATQLPLDAEAGVDVGAQAEVSAPFGPLAVLANALRVPHGTNAKELRLSFEAGEVRPALDPLLRDGGGFPILSYRVADLDEQMLTVMLGERGFTVEQEGRAWSAGQLRALALGADVVTELATAVDALPMSATPEGTLSESAPRGLPMLQVIALLPSEWDASLRQAAGNWFLQLIEQQGWPRERLSLAAPTLSGALAPFDAVERIAATSDEAENSMQAALGMLIACASHIDEETINEWQATGRLHTSRNGEGQIPGEGAAGLLLANVQLASNFGSRTFPTLHRAVRALHDNPGAARRGEPDLLVGLATEAMTAAGTETQQVALLAGDCDQRANRQAEFLGMSSSAFPDLDPKTQCYALGTANGSAAAVSTVLALALCSDEVAENAGAALCVSNGDALGRAAAVVSPVRINEAMPREV